MSEPPVVGPGEGLPGAALPSWRLVQAVTVLLVLGFFLFGLREILNPFLLFFLLWAVLVPFRGTPGRGTLLTTAAVLTLFWLLATTGSLLAPFVLALVLAYILDPVVDWLGERGVARTWGILLLTLPVVGLLALVLFVALPAAVGQIGEVTARAPIFLERLVGWVQSVSDRLLVVDLPFVDQEVLLQRLLELEAEAVATFLQERSQQVGQWIWDGLTGVGRGLGAVAGILSYLVLTPVLTFYLLRDWDRMTAAIADLLPAHRREGAVEFAREYDQLLGRYLRGQATVALSVGAITALGLWAVRFPYAGTLGLIVAVFSVVPYLGLVLSLLPALFIAVVSGNVLLSLGKVALVYGIAQGLEGAVISPRIVGDSVGLHPVLVVLALAVGGFFFGFVGLLLAVPGAVGIKLLVTRGVARYRASPFYHGVEGA
jgi:predicted PurR-regulated permease PerM